MWPHPTKLGGPQGPSGFLKDLRLDFQSPVLTKPASPPSRKGSGAPNPGSQAPYRVSRGANGALSSLVTLGSSFALAGTSR